MKNKRKHVEDLEKAAPVFFSIPKKEIFVVPEGYFEKLPLKIQERLGKDRSSLFRFSLIYIFRPEFAVAFLVIVLFSFGITYLMPTGQSVSSPTAVLKQEKAETKREETVNILPDINSITKEEVQSKQFESIDEQVIIEEISNEAMIEDQEIFSEEEKLASNDIPQEDKINYLLDNDIDVLLILEEL